MKRVFIFAISFCLLSVVKVYAGQFVQIPGTVAWVYYDVAGDMNTMVRSAWREVDSDGDGYKEYYYFGQDGIMIANDFTPDGYYVNANGQWEKAGVVQKSIVGNEKYIYSKGNVVNSNSKLLINNVISKEGIAVVGSVMIGTDRWKNCLKMSGNGSYIVSNCGANNLFYTVASFKELVDGFSATLTLYIDGKVYNTWTDFSTQVPISVHMNNESQITLVYSVQTNKVITDKMSLYLQEPAFGSVLN